MIATSIEQSKKLIELGVNPDTADFVYPIPLYATEYGKLQLKTNVIVGLKDLSAWSLSALTAMIPDCNLVRIDDDGEQLWYCNTMRFGKIFFHYDGDYHDNPFDACIEAIEWLCENGHLGMEESQ